MISMKLWHAFAGFAHKFRDNDQYMYWSLERESRSGGRRKEGTTAWNV